MGIGVINSNIVRPVALPKRIVAASYGGSTHIYFLFLLPTGGNDQKNDRYTKKVLHCVCHSKLSKITVMRTFTR